MAPLLKFTLLRIALFLAVLALLYVAGARSWLLLLLAAVISLALSYILLRGPRDELAAALAARSFRERTSWADEDAEAEDADADAEDADADVEGADAADREPRRSEEG